VTDARLAALDASIARALSDAEAGRVKPADEVFDRLEAKYRATVGK
jgi:antitoxin ParD1/3/4